MNIKVEKDKIRREIKVLKNKISFEEKQKRSSIIFNKIEMLDVFQNAKTILLYWSMKDEVNTHEFIIKWANEKKILLPVVAGDILELKEFKGIDQLKQGEAFGISEPIGKIFREFSGIDLAIMPGIAFDKQNNRMGRGEAYYDKLLIRIPAYKIGVCFGFQLLDKIPINASDINMDLIITD